jgi:hypothetical protein
MKKIIFVFILFLLIPLVYSFNFGTVPKNDYQTIKQGESTQFTILLWNLGESSYQVNVELKTELLGWDILVRPKDFILQPTPIVKPPYDDGEYIEIPGKGNVRAETLRVFVKTPDYVEPGRYELVLVAKAGNPEGQVSVFQEREFKLTVEIEKNPTIFERTANALKVTGQKIVQQGNNVRNTITGMATNIPFNPLITFFVGLILILSAIGIVLVKKK